MLAAARATAAGARATSVLREATIKRRRVFEREFVPSYETANKSSCQQVFGW